MKKIFYIVTILIGLSIANSSLALPPPAPPGKEEEEREAARLRSIEYQNYLADTRDYFNPHDEAEEQIRVFGGNTEFFSCSLQCNTKTGDLLLVIESKGNKKVEVNLSYNIDTIFTKQFFAKNVTGGSIPPRDTVDTSILFRNPGPVTVERRGIAYLYAGEMYVKRIKIWDIELWDDLVQEAEKRREANFKLEYGLVLKVDETFYRTKATCEIPARAVLALKNVRVTQERQAASAPPKVEHSDRQLRVTITQGEKGESQIKLEPVQIEPE